MRRRAVLAAGAAVLAAGCTGPSGGTGTDTSGDPSVASMSLAVAAVDCGSETETASVSFDGDEDVVDVVGATTGRNTCYAARLAAVDYDAGRDQLRLVVEAYETDTGGCAECIVTVDYEATVAFSGGLPGSVVVVHRSMGDERVVASARP